MDIVSNPALQDDLHRAIAVDIIDPRVREDPATYASPPDDTTPVSQALLHGEELRLTREIITGLAQRRRWRAGPAATENTPAEAGSATALDPFAALDLTVSGIERRCERYRHARSPGEAADNAAAYRAHQARNLDWRRLDERSIEIRLRLPTDLAAEVIATLELHEDLLREDAKADAPPDASTDVSAGSGTDSETPPPLTARRCRADAAVRMAVCRLAATGEAVATADRYRVNITADLATLRGAPEGVAPTEPVGIRNDAATETAAPTPRRRPHIAGIGPIAPATAQRLVCDAGLSMIATGNDGELLDVGRRQRAWPARRRRAIIAQQGCCQVPGCGATH